MALAQDGEYRGRSELKRNSKWVELPKSRSCLSNPSLLLTCWQIEAAVAPLLNYLDASLDVMASCMYEVGHRLAQEPNLQVQDVFQHMLKQLWTRIVSCVEDLLDHVVHLCGCKC